MVRESESRLIHFLENKPHPIRFCYDLIPLSRNSSDISFAVIPGLTRDPEYKRNHGCRIESGMTKQPHNSKKYLAPFVLGMVIFAAPWGYAVEESPALAQDAGTKVASSDASVAGDVPPQAEMNSKMLLPPPQETRAEDMKKLVLKIMIVNPSPKHQQKYPIKAALPAEIEPRHILSKEDLQVAYDAENGNYYLTQEVILDPGQSVVKTIEVEDVWRISTDTLKGLSEEAAGLMKKMQGTTYEEKARLLVQNTEVLLTQIYESQDDPKMTPQQHIELFHDNKQKLKEIELDLVALRRLVFDSTGEKGITKSGEGAAGSFGFLGAGFRANDLGKNLSGAIPGWVAWRIIFVIIGLLIVATGVFYGIWVSQLRKIEQNKPESSSTKFTQRSTEALFQDVLDPGAKGASPQNKEKRAVEDLLPPPLPESKPGKSNK